MKIEKFIEPVKNKREAIALAEEIISMLEKSEFRNLFDPIVQRTKTSLRALLPKNRKHTEKNSKDLIIRKRNINNRTRDLSTNSNQRWTLEEDRKIFESEITDELLAVEIGRSMLAIQGRRFIIRKRKENE